MRIKIITQFIFLFVFCKSGATQTTNDSRFLTFITKPTEIAFYWKNNNGTMFRSIQNLKTYLENRNEELRFAMNAGMYRQDGSPQGLFIEKGSVKAPLDTASGAGNFYLLPNGVFYLINDSAVVCQTKNFKVSSNIKFATQSGPMLVINGTIHPAFKKGSVNLNIRNGVGILPDGRVVFVMSKQEVNFYDFAMFFKTLGCENALYLDGFVSRTYLPEQNWKQLDGNFGVIIGVVR